MVADGTDYNTVETASGLLTCDTWRLLPWTTANNGYIILRYHGDHVNSNKSHKYEVLNLSKAKTISQLLPDCQHIYSRRFL